MQLWIDLPMGVQRVLSHAAKRSQMSQEEFLRMLLVNAADQILEDEPERRFYDACRCVDEALEGAA